MDEQYEQLIHIVRKLSQKIAELEIDKAALEYTVEKLTASINEGQQEVTVDDDDA